MAAALESCSKAISLEGFDENRGLLGAARSRSQLFEAALGHAAGGPPGRRGCGGPGRVRCRSRESCRIGRSSRERARSGVRVGRGEGARIAFAEKSIFRVAVHIVSGTAPFSGTQLAGIAKAAGSGSTNRTASSGCGTMWTGRLRARPISNRPLTADGLNALFDARSHARARCPGGPLTARFARFRDCAQTFAQGLKARIVDDNREPVGPAAFDAIGAQLQAVHRSMEARGIVPGGALALRLFPDGGRGKRRANARRRFAARSEPTTTAISARLADRPGCAVRQVVPRVVELERAHPEFSRRIRRLCASAGRRSRSFRRVTHRTPMLSAQQRLHRRRRDRFDRRFARAWARTRSIRGGAEIRRSRDQSRIRSRALSCRGPPG